MAELTPLHALELLPDEAGRDAVRRDWQVLTDAGLPSQLQHRGVTNTPHLTLVSAPAISPDEEQRAADLLRPLLPIHARTSGLLLLGGKRLTVARSVDLDDDVVRAVLGVRAGVEGRRHPGWLPHLTLARRLPRDSAQAALDVLGQESVDILLSEVRRWDPEKRTVTVLAAAP